MLSALDAAGEQIIAGGEVLCVNPGLQGSSRLLSQFKANRPPDFLLNNRGSGLHTARVRHIWHADFDQIATPQLAVDGQIEKREVLMRSAICSRIRIAQTSCSLSGGF